MSLDSFIEKFNGFTEPYFFYNGEIELRYEPKGHVYYRMVDGEFVAQDGVTTVVHIIDKSDALIPWGCKMMAAKILAEAPIMTLPTGERMVSGQTYEDFEKLVLGAKNAHQEEKDKAANIGGIAHAWIEQYIKADIALNPIRMVYLRTALFPENERAANCCEAALKWMEKHNVRWICTERKVYSREWEYAGTMDGLAFVDSCDDPLCCPTPFVQRRSLIDWKSSNYLYLEYLLQTAAYEAAYEEEMQEPVYERWVIRLGKDDGEFDPWHVGVGDFEQDFQGFLEALALHRSVAAIQARLKARAQGIRAAKKARAQKERDEALKIKCKGADRYKGVRPPKCNGGSPCQTCLDKYEQRQQDRDSDALIGLSLSRNKAGHIGKGSAKEKSSTATLPLLSGIDNSSLVKSELSSPSTFADSATTGTLVMQQNDLTTWVDPVVGGTWTVRISDEKQTNQ